MNVDPETYQRIAETIKCEKSPVGIDAQKTHVYIIDMLLKIQARLERIERRLDANGIE
jgi:hypothetical protein